MSLPEIPFRMRPPRRGFRNEPAKQRLLAGVATMREGQIATARALIELDESGHAVFDGCASIGELGERYGVSAADARRLHALGRAMEAFPELEQRVREGRIPVTSGAVIGWVVMRGLLLPGDRWLEWAETESTSDLMERYERRREEAVSREAADIVLRFFVTTGTRDQFRRARVLASRKEGYPLTPGQTFACMVEHFVDCFDMLAKTPRRRRMPDTRGRPGRARAAEVKRELMMRGADRCSVPFCDNKTFLENAHGVAKAEGGDQESANTSRDCTAHHTMKDSGQMQMRGTPQDPRYETNDGRSLSRRFGTPTTPEKPPDAGCDPPGGSASCDVSAPDG